MNALRCCRIACTLSKSVLNPAVHSRACSWITDGMVAEVVELLRERARVLDMTVGVVDDPAARDQLSADGAFVRNLDVVREQVLVVARGALLGQIPALHLNPDALGCRITHSKAIMP